MNWLQKIFKKNISDKTETTKSDVKEEKKEEPIVNDYGFPKEKDKPFDFYAKALKTDKKYTENENVHVDSKNCKIVLRLTEKEVTKWHNYGSDETYRTDITIRYRNYYKTNNGNYVLQTISSNKNEKSFLNYPVSKSDMINAYIYSKECEDFPSIENLFQITAETSYLNVEVFNKNEIVKAIKEW